MHSKFVEHVFIAFYRGCKCNQRWRSKSFFLKRKCRVLFRAVHHILIYQSFISFLSSNRIGSYCATIYPLLINLMVSYFLAGVQTEPAIWYFSSRNWISKYFVKDMFGQNNKTMCLSNWISSSSERLLLLSKYKL